ncbi:unnamed protein product [Cuscuta europaea]|uniref:Reverse transcriptase domain-containing protein n=1 Tax=Cuscuta europaea TaxID=41803 RepID=A0A9P0ZT28_CUSEU|nr:unnamed protein product [Cuscuta europaea]
MQYGALIKMGLLVLMDTMVVTSNEGIGEAVISFFSHLYSLDPNIEADEILQHIPKIVSNEDNYMLMKLPESEEIKNAVWGLNQNGAPGPDGYNGKFFRKCWDIVDQDMISAVQEFFLGISIPQGISSSLVTLIPKVDNPSTFGDFRPICLSNFVSKVCTKVLADTLSLIFPKIISAEQIGFMKNKDMVEHILIA